MSKITKNDEKYINAINEALKDALRWFASNKVSCMETVCWDNNCDCASCQHHTTEKESAESSLQTKQDVIK